MGELLPLHSQPAVRGLELPHGVLAHIIMIRKLPLPLSSMWVLFLTLQQCGMEPLTVYTIRCGVGKPDVIFQKLSLQHSEAITWLDQEEEVVISREVAFPMLSLSDWLPFISGSFIGVGVMWVSSNVFRVN